MKRRYVVTAAVALTGLVLAGCGSSESDSSGSGSSTATGSTKVTVGVGPGVSSLGVTNDAFAKNGLDIVKSPTTSPAQVTPLLLNGQLDIALGDPVGSIIAISQNVPLVIIAVATSSGTSAANDTTGLLVKDDGAITSAADLNGKKIGVTSIGGSAQMTASATIDKLGGDSKTVDFVEVPAQSMNSEVDKGTVDAVVSQEPTIAQGKSIGLKELFAPAAESTPSSPLIVYVTTQTYLKDHRDVVDSFTKALTESSAALNGNPDLVRSTAKSTYKLTDAQTAAMVLPYFVPTTVSKSKLEDIMDLMIKYGLIKSPVDLDTTIYNAP
ncbi:ABC transporter substrate-binding protein [Streptomyces sp. NPDC093544]|uniref:ABC transporter substrate-binding protein n=1 Tax=Streptomyces sp. NPDC093544 TaxID=3155200 RepID=UPI00343FD450